MGRKKKNSKNVNKGPTPFKSSRVLAPDETHLWQLVKHTIEPREKPTSLEEEFSSLMKGGKKSSPSTAPAISTLKSTTAIEPEKNHRSYAMPSYSPPVSTPKQTTALNSPIDRPTMRKLAKGRLNIDSRIDLH
ncbi:MAG: hypothetical protein AB8B49_03005, partial [Nitratireductor sp.]